MTSVTFSISRVNRLRNAAARARAPAEPTEPTEPDDPWLEPEERDGWAVSDCDPNDLIGVFKALQLKAGFAVHAYEFRSGGNGNGIIWAVPADAPLLAPEDCPRLEGVFPDRPRPPGAIPLMEAIEGDGSPWSWSAQKIVAKPPREAGGHEPSRAPDSRDDAPMGGWFWHGPVPRTWSPAYSESAATKRIVLYIRNPVGRETIYRATDTYRGDSYVCETSSTEVCTGPGGFVY